VLRAGFVVRERVTLDLRCFFAVRRDFFADGRAVVFLVVFLAALEAFLEPDAFALEREARAFELEVALERVLLVALRDRALFFRAVLVVNKSPSSRAHGRAEPMSHPGLYQSWDGAAKRFRCHPSCIARGITVKSHQRLERLQLASPLAHFRSLYGQ
jgi:hypothetical protein